MKISNPHQPLVLINKTTNQKSIPNNRYSSLNNNNENKNITNFLQQKNTQKEYQTNNKTIRKNPRLTIEASLNFKKKRK